MIFVTVGTQLPFPRLIDAVTSYFAGKQDVIVMQTAQDQFHQGNICAYRHLAPAEFSNYIKESELIISHAGIGSVLTAMDYGKPIIAMPRREKFGEHRNDHQMATYSQLNGRPGIHFAMDIEELGRLLDRKFELDPMTHAGESIERSLLVSSLGSYIYGAAV